jgi:FkbM family methyltransferase
MGLLNTAKYIWNHPLTAGQRGRAFARYVRWQVGSRLSPGPVVVPFVNGARLLVRPGMTGATGNVYTGLHEFEDMAFVLHALRPEDTFVDVGANIGSYTILASRAVGARSIAFEPIASTFAVLLDNVRLNGVESRVQAHCVAVGEAAGHAHMTTTFDTGNRMVAEHSGAGTDEVPVVALDEVPLASEANLIKIDVEGFERAVLAGAGRTLASPSLLAVLMETNACAQAHGRGEAEAHEHLLELGFAPFSYAPFERRLRSLGRAHRLEGNTLYLRDPARVEACLRQSPSFEVLGQRL